MAGWFVKDQVGDGSPPQDVFIRLRMPLKPRSESDEVWSVDCRPGGAGRPARAGCRCRQGRSHAQAGRQCRLHDVPGGKGPDGLAPIGPAWREVAGKYAGQKDAAKTLTHVVQTGSNPYESHWKGKVSGLAMPPNKVAISEADTKKLVGWILALDPVKR
jgi:cytochrome c551/c552